MLERYFLLGEWVNLAGGEEYFYVLFANITGIDVQILSARPESEVFLIHI